MAARVMVVGGDETDRCVASPALVEVTRHVPALVAVSELPEIAQPLAVPFAAVNVIAPVPEPPLVRSARALPSVPVRVVMVSADWANSTVAAIRNVGSLENVIVAVPSTVAVPTASRPAVVTS